jgi:membrane protease YdiL (CAAX protease family)
MTLTAVWQRLPVILRAVVTGSVVAASGALPWSVLALINLKFSPSVPWSVAITAIYLWLFWQYLQGKGWPRATAEARRENLRAGSLSSRVWRWSLLAGSLGIASLVALLRVINRLVELPQEQLLDVSQIPFVTVLSFILMSAAVAGIVEEAAFRGYMQAPIERRYGPIVAILTVGIIFGFFHFNHPEVSVILMPLYLAASLIYGALAYLTGSILPGAVLHASGNALGGVLLWWRGHMWWQGSSTPEPLVWDAGTDLSFWTNCLEAIVFGLTAVWAYRRLAVVMRSETEPGRRFN